MNAISVGCAASWITIQSRHAALDRFVATSHSQL
jgi:hypothetical protein